MYCTGKGALLVFLDMKCQTRYILHSPKRLHSYHLSVLQIKGHHADQHSSWNIKVLSWLITSHFPTWQGMHTSDWYYNVTADGKESPIMKGGTPAQSLILATAKKQAEKRLSDTQRLRHKAMRITPAGLWL